MHNNIYQLQYLLRYYSKVLQSLGDVPMAHTPKIINEQEKINTIATVVKNDIKKPTVQKPSLQCDVKKIIPQRPAINNISKSKIESQNTTNAINLDNITTLEELKKKLDSIELCEIQQFATNTVFGDGNQDAKIIVIGEAPGQDEDEKGIPFCGRSGQLLMNAFASIGLSREKNFFITNNIFWRPPGNRKPSEEEVMTCKPFVKKISEIIRPEVIICVGAVASQNILETDQTISLMRGKQFNTTFGCDVKVFCIYHPSYLLRNPSKKYEMYKDLVGILPHISHLL